ncbi:MAG TPA: hypothetical protein VMU36_02080 [Spirochaetia bacterium]|nr:hypothetical protein [Spirochaetia bacterium]
MGLFGSDRSFNIKDRQEILQALASRGQWNLIRTDVLRALIDNADGDVLKISRFVFVSEYFDCVRNNFVELDRIWEDPRLALSSFGATLMGLARDIIQHLATMPEGSERQRQATSAVELSFLSAILCDRNMLSAYKALASFYLATGKKDLAVSACRQYDEAEQRLLQSPDEYSRSYRETKYKPVAAGLRAEVDRLKSSLGIVHG